VRVEVSAVTDEYMTSAQYEALRGLKPGSARAERVRGGGCRYLKPTARKVLYKKSDVIAWLERRSFTSTAEEAAALPPEVREARRTRKAEKARHAGAAA
jgi:hypothetical protein